MTLFTNMQATAGMYRLVKRMNALMQRFLLSALMMLLAYGIIFSND